jgi:uncharacterized membrane protein
MFETRTNAAIPMNETEVGTPGAADLLALRFDDDLKAREALLAFTRLARRQSLVLEDAAIAARNLRSKVRILQTRDTSPSRGALMGSWWGFLIGLFLAQPFLGAMIGAALGWIWASLRDIGLDDREMRALAENLRPGDAALFLLLRDAYPTHLIRELRRFDGQILATTITGDTRADLEEALATML